MTTVRLGAVFSIGNAGERQYSNLVAGFAGLWRGRSRVAHPGVLQSIAQSYARERQQPIMIFQPGLLECYNSSKRVEILAEEKEFQSLRKSLFF